MNIPVETWSDEELDEFSLDPRNWGTVELRLVMDEGQARARGKPQLVVYGTAPSYGAILGHAGHEYAYNTTVQRDKDCRCDSHTLFAFGHEKQCDYYEEKKR